MAYTARRVDYFHATLSVRVDEAFDLLDHLAQQGVNFVAVTMIPIGPGNTQLTLFPEDGSQLQAVAKQINFNITGPNQALFVQGDDEPGVLAGIHKQLSQENIEVYASNAVTDGKGRYGCILYLRAEDADRAVKLLRG